MSTVDDKKGIIKKKANPILGEGMEITLHEFIDLQQHGCEWKEGSDDIFSITDPTGLSEAMQLPAANILIKALNSCGILCLSERDEKDKRKRFFQYQGPADYAFSRQVCVDLPRKEGSIWLPPKEKEGGDYMDLASEASKRAFLGNPAMPDNVHRLEKRAKTNDPPPAQRDPNAKRIPPPPPPEEGEEAFDKYMFEHFGLKRDQQGHFWVGTKPFRKPPPRVIHPSLPPPEEPVEGDDDEGLDYSDLPLGPPADRVMPDPDDEPCPEFAACEAALKKALEKNKGPSVAEEIKTAIANVNKELEKYLERSVRPKWGLEPGEPIDPLDPRFDVESELDQWWDTSTRGDVRDNEKWDSLDEEEKDKRIKEQEWCQRRRALHVAHGIDDPNMEVDEMPFVECWEELCSKIKARFGYLEVVGIRDPPKTYTLEAMKYPKWCEARNLESRDEPHRFPHGYPMTDYTRLHPPDILFLLDSFPDNEVFLQQLYQSPQKKKGTPDGDPDYLLDSEEDDEGAD